MNEGVAFNTGRLLAALACEGGAVPNVFSKKSFTAIWGGTWYQVEGCFDL
jgi:hypothetical protein